MVLAAARLSTQGVEVGQALSPSASATPADEQRCLAAGADCFLTKPVDVHVLLETIGRLLKLDWTVRAGGSPGSG